MIIDTKDYLAHHGIAGQKWGVRRYQNEDGSLTPEGYEHYGYKQNGKVTVKSADKFVSDMKISENMNSGFKKEHYVKAKDVRTKVKELKKLRKTDKDAYVKEVSKMIDSKYAGHVHRGATATKTLIGVSAGVLGASALALAGTAVGTGGAAGMAQKALEETKQHGAPFMDTMDKGRSFAKVATASGKAYGIINNVGGVAVTGALIGGMVAAAKNKGYDKSQLKTKTTK